MSRLLRIVSMDASVEDVRRLGSCLDALRAVRVALQHLDGSRSGIARLRRLQADAFFIDEDLPRVTGVETVRALRTNGDQRLIIATAKIDCGYLAADMMRAGADGYLAKRDLNPEMVRRVLERALRTARSREASDLLRRSTVRRMIATHGQAAVGLG